MHMTAITYLVRDYDEAISWFCNCLDFELVEDTPLSAAKRWVKIKSLGSTVCLLLAKAEDDQQQYIGKAAGSRVAYFLHTEDFEVSHNRMTKAGVRFNETPRLESYGTVAVFQDLYGNLWDLIEQSRQ